MLNATLQSVVFLLIVVIQNVLSVIFLSVVIAFSVTMPCAVRLIVLAPKPSTATQLVSEFEFIPMFLCSSELENVMNI